MKVGESAKSLGSGEHENRGDEGDGSPLPPAGPGKPGDPEAARDGVSVEMGRSEEPAASAEQELAAAP
jgi:hypothetical protein